MMTGRRKRKRKGEIKVYSKRSEEVPGQGDKKDINRNITRTGLETGSGTLRIEVMKTETAVMGLVEIS